MPPPIAQSPINLSTLLYQFATTRTGTLALYTALLLVGYPIEQIAFPELYGRIVDVIAKPSASPLLQRTWKYLVIATVLLMVSQVIFTWIDYLDAYLQPALESYYREHVLDGVLRTFERRYKDVEVGEIVSKLSKLPLIVRNLYHQVRAYMLPAVLVSAFACGYFAYLHWGLGLMLLVLLVAFFLFFGWKASTCIPASQKRDAMCDSLNDGMDDTLNNLLAVYTNTNVRREQQRFRRQQSRHDAQYTRSAMCGVSFKAWYSVYYIGLFILINGYAFYLTHTGAIAMGKLVSIVFVTLYLIGNIGDFAGEIKDFMFNVGVMAEMQRYLDELFAFGDGTAATIATSPTTRTSTASPTAPATPPTAPTAPPTAPTAPPTAPTAPPTAPTAPPTAPTAPPISPPISSPTPSPPLPPFHIPKGTIRFDNVLFRYPNNPKPALNHATFEIAAGSTVALVGKIGSGKSTVTKLLLRLYTPDSGHITIDGTDITQHTPEAVRKCIGYVPQTPTLFNRTIYENIVYGSKRPLSKREVALYIRQSGVEPLFETVSHGLDTVAGKRGEHLSGGQRQAVALLRMALAGTGESVSGEVGAASHPHQVILLDEPTSALDHESKHYVLRLIQRLMRGRTCVVVTHDEEVVRLCGGEVVVFRGGRVVGEG